MFGLTPAFQTLPDGYRIYNVNAPYSKYYRREIINGRKGNNREVPQRGNRLFQPYCFKL